MTDATSLPDGWAEASLGDIMELKYGSSLPAKKRDNNGYPVYGSNGEVGKHSEPLVTGECLIVGRKGSIGEVHRSKQPCSPIDTTYYIDSFYGQPISFLQNMLIFLPLKKMNRATALPGLNREEAYGLDIQVPPINEQHRIADKIDALQAKSRRAHTALEAVGPLLEKFQQSVLAAAFRGDLTAEWRNQHPDVEPAEKLLQRTPAPQQGRGGKMPTATVIKGRAAISVNDPRTVRPEGWEWVSLLRVARQETGHTPSRKHPEYWDGDIPWVAIPDAGENHGGFIHETHQHVTQEGLDNSSARLLPKDTVCLSRTASVGYVVIMGRAMATSQDFVTWTCSEALDPEYLMYALLAEGDHIRKFGKGSTHTTIYFPEVRALHICLAPIEEQREIVRIVKSALGRYENAAANVAAMHEVLTPLDQSILAKAFRGELVPQDPNDEPASVLLERIKAEREAGTGKKRTRKKAE